MARLAYRSGGRVGVAEDELVAADTPDWESWPKASLQDYWRRDFTHLEFRALSDEALKAAGELVAAPDETVWHIAHQPAAWRDGAATWKADLDHAAWALLAPRLRAGAETKIEYSSVKGVER